MEPEQLGRLRDILDPHPPSGGAIAQGQDANAVGANAVVIARDNSGAINTGTQLTAVEGAQIVYAEQGATVVIGEAPVTMTAVDRESASPARRRHRRPRANPSRGDHYTMGCDVFRYMG